MMKINAVGITGDVFNWIEDWLNDRELRVVLFGSHSEWIKLKSGVPQGSVLASLLFLIYINDIVYSVCAKLLKFADDTKVFSVVSTKNVIVGLQIDLINLGKWSREMNGKYLEEVIKERDLRVIIRSDLNCCKQCLKAISTANKVLGKIKRTLV